MADKPDDLPALSKHLGEDNRCPENEVQVEGVDNTKWQLISVYGITWEKIYEIIWPGVPAPESCASSKIRIQLVI